MRGHVPESKWFKSKAQLLVYLNITEKLPGNRTDPNLMHSLAFKVNVMAKAMSNTGRLAMIMNNRKMGYTLLAN